MRDKYIPGLQNKAFLFQLAHMLKGKGSISKLHFPSDSI